MRGSLAVERGPALDAWPWEEGPCDECPHAKTCRDRQQACAQFRSFNRLQFGDRWRTEPRVPSMKIYRQVFERKPVMWRPRKAVAVKASKPRRPRDRRAALDAREARLQSFMISD
jgi:hypothetical protein